MAHQCGENIASVMWQRRNKISAMTANAVVAYVMAYRIVCGVVMAAACMAKSMAWHHHV